MVGLRHNSRFGLSVLALLVSCAGGADDTVDSPWQLGAAIGYGQRTNPLVNADDIDILVNLDIGWFGERFFFDNGDLGVTLADTPAVTVNAAVRFNSDREFFTRARLGFVTLGDTAVGSGDPTTGDPGGDPTTDGSGGGTVDDPEVEPVTVAVDPPNRRYATEAGLELLTDGDWGHLNVSAFGDVSGAHDGYEVALGYGFGIVRARWFLQPSIGVSYVSASQNDYFWGVRADEASEGRPAYQAGAGINYRARFKASYFLTDRWTAALAVEYEKLDDDIAASPLVAEDEVIGFFAGLGYQL